MSQAEHRYRREYQERYAFNAPQTANAPKGGQSILAKLREMRNWKHRNPAVPEPLPFNTSVLRQAINKDQALTRSQKEELQNWVDSPDVINKLQSGGIGAALGYMLSKYLRLSPQTQLLLSIAGFGVGKMVYDYKSDPKRFSSWNPSLKMYEIND